MIEPTDQVVPVSIAPDPTEPETRLSAALQQKVAPEVDGRVGGRSASRGDETARSEQEEQKERTAPNTNTERKTRIRISPRKGISMAVRSNRTRTGPEHWALHAGLPLASVGRSYSHTQTNTTQLP